jgi:hypothetical protein
VTAADRVIGWTTAVAVIAVAAVAAVASYEHAYDLVRAHGEAGWTARLVPLTAPVYSSPHGIACRSDKPEPSPHARAAYSAAQLTGRLGQLHARGPVSGRKRPPGGPLRRGGRSVRPRRTRGTVSGGRARQQPFLTRSQPLTVGAR